MWTLGVQIYEQKQPIHHENRKEDSVNIALRVCPNVAKEDGECHGYIVKIWFGQIISLPDGGKLCVLGRGVSQ